jgi:sensor histidine kinase YesM
MRRVNRVKEWIAQRGLALRWFVSLFVLTAILLGTLAWNNLNDAERALKRQYVSNTEALNDKINGMLDVYADNIRNTLHQLSVRADLLTDPNEAPKALQAIGDFNLGYIKTMYLIGKDGTVYSSKQLIYELVGNTSLPDLYELAVSNPHAIQWTEPYESKLSGRTVAFVQAVYDDKKQLAGAAVAEVDLDSLTNRLLPLLSGNDRTFTILTSKNNVLSVDQGSSLIPYNIYPPTMNDAFRLRLAGLPEGASELAGPKGSMMAVKSFGNHMGWSLITLLDERYFGRATQDLSANIRQTAAIWLLVLILGTVLLIRMFMSPIRLLISRMDRVDQLEYPAAIAIRRKDEIGKLAQSYNEMMARIYQLVLTVKKVESDKKEFELKMLQSQIAPHFLYNTLACISSLSKQQRFAEVDETIRSLTHLLSFSFDKISELVTLEEEIEAVRSYVYIQSVRYGSRFELVVDVPESLRTWRLPKLSIQPLIENAIFHGVIPAKRKGLICLRAKAAGNRLHIVVADNGVGMDKMAARSLLDDSGRGRSGKTAIKGFNSVGLYNVHHRFRIQAGEPYGLRIVSRKRKGTIVRIVAPYMP